MAKKQTIITGAAAAAAAATAAAGFSYYWLFVRPQPKKKGRTRLPGLEKPVEILYDLYAVPHIYADSMHDLFYAQGFVHAGERLWQMDLQRRLASGRLAEIKGAEGLPVDRWLRILGLRRAAELQLARLDKQARDILEAYSAGVNAFIAQNRLPVEMNLARYKPEPWQPLDSLAWTKMMAWMLSVNWETEILRSLLIEHLGSEKAAELEPAGVENWPVIIQPGQMAKGVGVGALERSAAAAHHSGPSARAGLGSNSWVIGPERTTTGAPLLANDMHLLLSMPSIWYENHLVCSELTVTGVSFPGIPGVVAGHNQHVAWGFTNGFPDVQDLFMEQLRRTPEGKVEYLYKDAWLPAQVLQEEIRIKGGETATQEVIITRHGPIINALDQQETGEQPLALCWTALEGDEIVHAILHMGQARNCLEYRDALRVWSDPVQNMVYADVEGNIGYSYPGRIPIRGKGDGRIPVPGWSGEYDWLGHIPFDQLPHLYNPADKFIVTANNRAVDDSYPYDFGRDFVAGSRAQRIRELIEEREKLSLVDMAKIQVDQVSPAARAFVAALQTLELENPETPIQSAVHRVLRWDGSLDVNSPQAAFYEVCMLRLLYTMLSPRLGNLTERYLGKGPTPVLEEGSIMGEHAREWLRQVLGQPDSAWYDLGNGEKRSDILWRCIQETYDFLSETCGPDFEDWSWGKLHSLTFGHALGSQKGLEKLFNRGPIPLGGDFDTVWSAGTSLHDMNNKAMVGPPYRMILDLSDWNRSLSMLAPGQSGHPRNKYYDNNIKHWLEGDYHPMPFDREVVEAAAQSRLVLEPKSLTKK